MTVTWVPSAGPPWFDDGCTSAAVEAALAHGGRAGIEISVVFVDDAEISDLHGRWFEDPTPTDVISFDLGDEGPGPAGELYVSSERAQLEARARGLSAERELALYLVHGTLHLCGYDDHEPQDRSRMRDAEASVLAGLGYESAPGVDEGT